MFKHIIKSLPEFISNFLDLELLSVYLILNVINSLVKFCYVNLPIFKTYFRSLKLILNAEIFLLLALLLFQQLSRQMSPRSSCFLLRTIVLLRFPLGSFQQAQPSQLLFSTLFLALQVSMKVLLFIIQMSLLCEFYPFLHSSH